MPVMVDWSTVQCKSSTANKKSVGSFPHGFWVISIAVYVYVQSTPSYSHSKVGVLFPFPRDSNVTPIPTGNPIPMVISVV